MNGNLLFPKLKERLRPRLRKDRETEKPERPGAGRDVVSPHGELGHFDPYIALLEAPIPARVGFLSPRAANLSSACTLESPGKF